MKITASRISEGNAMFPPSITIEESGITVKFPGFFSGKSTYIDYDSIDGVSLLIRI